MAQSDISKEQFLEKLGAEEIAGNITMACRSLKLARTTVYYWKGLDKDFSDKMDKIIEDARETFADEAEYGLRKNVLEGNITAQIFVTKNLRPDRWKDKREVGGEAGKPIQVEMAGLAELLNGKK